ncbi:hypothetical protein HVPorG_04915 [Roseomonas mucosa]|nr:hypothetical protein HVPorG_04915 [Roseomonas mucosa]
MTGGPATDRPCFPGDHVLVIPARTLDRPPRACARRAGRGPPRCPSPRRRGFRRFPASCLRFPGFPAGASALRARAADRAPLPGAAASRPRHGARLDRNGPASA